MVKPPDYYKSKIGTRYGLLTVVEILSHRHRNNLVLCVCLCDCGKYTVTTLSNVVSGNTSSCGCLAIKCKRSSASKRKTHGMSKHPIYAIWSSIKERCDNKKLKVYGAIGIKMCELWRNNFLEFYRWAVENGWKDGLHIDRYPNNKGNYEPSNCRIVSVKVNMRNRTSSVMIEYHGQSRCIAEWAELYNINYHTFRNRLRSGWDIEKALTCEIRPY